MMRIRFHGRGGHGVKTASRITGTAAFLSGYQVQDSPIYGAERRGAAVVAFTRISREPIRERGVIEHPDIVMVADETLFRDPAAGVTLGLADGAVVWVNCEHDAAYRSLLHRQPPLLQSCDVTGRARELLGKASALSAGMAAAAVRLTGWISRPTLVTALREEFSELGLHSDEIDRNRDLALAVYDQMQPVVVRAASPSEGGGWVRVAYQGPDAGAPSIVRPGNAVSRATGWWRLERPLVDRSRCTRCGLCVVRCPDGAMALDVEGFPEIDYEHCKGCLICREACPIAAMDTQKETRAW